MPTHAEPEGTDDGGRFTAPVERHPREPRVHRHRTPGSFDRPRRRGAGAGSGRSTVLAPLGP